MKNTDWLLVNEMMDVMMRCIEDENIKDCEILEVLTENTIMLHDRTITFWCWYLLKQLFESRSRTSG